MIIPIGHDQQEVRRLPWVTFATIALNLVVFLGIGTTGDELQRKAAEAAQRAFDYWAEHPYLEIPDEFMRRVAPGERSREQLQVIIEARKSLVEVPQDREQRASEQAELRRLVDAFMSMESDHPYSKWGLVPSKMSLAALVTSMFMHAGWMHLLGNLFMLYLAGPPVEDAFGRPLFAAVYLVGGIVAALAHVVTFPESATPLVGASGAIAAVMGVFMVRCARSNIRFFYWWFFHGGTFDAPAWLMLPLWLGQQFLYASLVRTEGGVAYWAHVGGFVFGAAAAFVIRVLDVESKYIHPAIEKRISLQQHPALDEGMALLVRGETEAARRELRKVLQDDPRNPDARLGMWQSFVSEGRPDQGVDHMVRVIEDELRRKELGLARDHWLELVQSAGTGGPAQLRWRLASELHATDPAASNDVFRHLAADGTAGLLAEKAAARLGLAPPAALPDRQPIAAEGPASPPAPPPPAAVADRSAAPPVPPPPPVPGPALATPPEPAPWPTARPHSGGVFTSVEDAPPPQEIEPRDVDESLPDWDPDPFSFQPAPEMPAPRLSIEECILERLEEEGLVLRSAGGSADLLPYNDVTMIAVAGVRSSERAYLVVDLLAPAGGGSFRAYRLFSNQMDPRRFVTEARPTPMEAFRALVRRLLDATGATLLPGLDALDRPVTFTSIDSYEDEVLAGYR